MRPARDRVSGRMRFSTGTPDRNHGSLRAREPHQRSPVSMQSG